MEGFVFRSPVVNRVLKTMIEARLHTDGSGPERERIAAENRALQEKLLEKLGNPMFVVLDPESETVLGRLHKAEFDPDTFAAFLTTAQAKLASTRP